MSDARGLDWTLTRLLLLFVAILSITNCHAMQEVRAVVAYNAAVNASPLEDTLQGPRGRTRTVRDYQSQGESREAFSRRHNSNVQLELRDPEWSQ